MDTGNQSQSSYSAALAYMDEPSQVKAALPIAYVLEQAGVQLMQEGGRLSAVCPFHDDHSPSFDVYQWGDVERFGCFACGVGGDVFDLIQRFWPMGFRASVEAGKRAIEKMRGEGWQAPTLSAAPPWDEQAAKQLLMKGRVSSVEPTETLIRNKSWPFTAEWLVNRFGVAAVGGEVLVPYWNVARELVAIKHRPASGGRPLISLPGSRLKGCLYGEWTATGTAPILLCEGESDTWSASWQLGQDVDVFGLPTGAGALPFSHPYLDRREVWLGFDGDDAGVTATGHWKPLLESWGCEVFVLPVPLGHDLTSYGDIRELVGGRI